MIEKYFGLTLKDVMPRRKVRKDEETLELDILAYAGEKAFVVEVKSSYIRPLIAWQTFPKYCVHLNIECKALM